MIDELTRRLDCIWYGMIRRCYGENLPQDTAIHYQDKGIAVCCEWRNSRQKFREWALKNGYKIGLTIDRIDSNGDYCPENCQWLTKSDNSKKAVIERERRKIEGHDPINGLWMITEKIVLFRNYATGRTFYGYKVLETGLYKSEALKREKKLNALKRWEHKYRCSATRNHRVGDIVLPENMSCFLNK